jgi:phosphoglycerate dehydrogenase-like enzyme
MLSPLGVNVIGVRHRAGDECIGLDELDNALPRTDHLVIALPGTEENRHFVDGAMLAKLPGHATLVNVGRGMVLDQDALTDALERGRLSAACLDVFEEEPLPMGARLRCCQRLWRMPHASAIAPNYLDLYIDDFLRQLRDMHL